MLTIAKTTISEKDLELFFEDSYIKYCLEKDKIDKDDLFGLYRSVAEQAGWNIDVILSETIQTIEDDFDPLLSSDRRDWDWLRGFLISQKYGISNHKPHQRTNEYYVDYASDVCVLIHSPRINEGQVPVQPESTIILTPQGEIKTPEGKVRIDWRSSGGLGFTAKWDGKYGLYTFRGDALLPCVFDDLVAPMFWERPVKLLYKGFLYNFLVEGEKQEMEIVDRETNDKPSSIAFIGKNGAFSLSFVGLNELGIIHPKNKTFAHEVENPFDKLDDKTRELVMKKTEELFELVKIIHPDCFPKELLRMKPKQSKEHHTIRDAALETMIASSELSGRKKCQETILGYIRLMQANDKPVFIRIRYIVSVEPTKIARYHQTEGSLITLSVGGSDGLRTIKVIEPCEVVLKAIEKSIR